MSVVLAYVSLLLCILWLCILFVARANKVEGTMSWCLGTNEILASIYTWHCQRSNKGTLRPPSWFFTIFRLLSRLQVFRSITLIIFWFKRCVQWCSCLRVHILVWVLLQDISDRIRLSRTVQRTYLWVLFHQLQGRE